MLANKLVISEREISNVHPPFVIAEISANHNGKIANALKLIEEAAKAGADAVKIQTYRPDTITLASDREDFKISGGLWNGRTLFDLYQEAHLPWEWHADLFDYAKQLKIPIFSSPFDFSAIDYLEDLGTPAYKIASFEIVDLPLIDYAARTGKPLIISTGMANKQEISEAIAVAKNAGCNQLAVLHCVSGYPAPAEEYNLKTIKKMSKEFGVPVGLSDHTIGSTCAIASVVMGANIIEKHFTLDRTGGGPDDSFSMEPQDLEQLCRDVKIAWSSIGNATYERTESELGNVKFRRSLYYVNDLEAGSIITVNDIRSVRPGYGLSPKFFDKLVGMPINRDIQKHTPVLKRDFDFD